ncbi:MAG: phage holin family protein [Anaerolineae bacterium]|nr:phage holin family protein [Gemmatimonadaceae bacterium]
MAGSTRLTLERSTGGPVSPPRTETEHSLGDLFKRLSVDAAELLRQEADLAKVEIRETGATLARDAAKLSVAFAMGLAGVLSFAAFLVVALGDLLDNYWLGALVVAVAFLGTSGVLLKSALNDIKRRGLKPQETIGTLREDVDWARSEVKELKRELTR